MTICYHHNDLDGFAAAVVVRDMFPDTTLIEVNYGDDWDAKLVKDQDVWVVDFSFPDMYKLAACAKSVTWIDHHGTAAREYWEAWQDEETFNGIRDLGASGCELTWMYLHDDDDCPNFIKWIGDRDMWKFNHEQTREFCAAAFVILTDPTVNQWNELINPDTAEFTENLFTSIGKWLLIAQHNRVEAAAKLGSAIMLGDHSALMINCSNDISEIGEHVCSTLGYDIAIIYYITADNCKFSLRSKTVNVAAIAELFGGGGHPGAAGFTLNSIDDFCNNI